MSTPDTYILLVQDHTHLISWDLDYDYGYDTHVLYTSNNNTPSSHHSPTGWEHRTHYSSQQRRSESWMSVSTTLSSGSTTSSLIDTLLPSSTISTSPEISTAASPIQRNTTNTNSFPTSRPRNTTITTNVLTTTAYTSTLLLQTTNTNYVSTSTATQPAALATEATSLLASTTSLTRTNFILLVVFGSLILCLLVLIIILLYFYTRRRRRQQQGQGSDSGSEAGNGAAGGERRPGSIDSRRTSIAAPGAMFISQEPTSPSNRRHHQRGRTSLPRVSQAPLSLNMALSSNPYDGAGLGRMGPTIDPSLFPGSSHMVESGTGIGSRGGFVGRSGSGSGRIMPTAMSNTRFSRSASNPEPALWMPQPQSQPPLSPQPTLGNVPRGRVSTPIPFAFPRLNISSGGGLSRTGTVVGRSGGSGSPVSSLTPRDVDSGGVGLERQPSVPLYHRALQEQVEHQRERAGAEEAGRLGLPVITGFVGAGARGSGVSWESAGEMEGESAAFPGFRESEGGDLHDDDVAVESGSDSEGEDEEGEKEMEIYDAGIEGSGDYRTRRAAEVESPEEDSYIGNGHVDRENQSNEYGLGVGRRREVRSSTRASSGIFPE